MRDIARLPADDRSDLFRLTAQAMNVHEAIIEKDFWVCWVLDYLFHESPWQEHLVFKGGTSLSKAYAAIERFSEDIDLILHWQILDYADEVVNAPRSRTKRDAFAKEASERTATFLADRFVPAIHPDLVARLGSEIPVNSNGQDVFVHYPKAFSLGSIRPQIRLEIGPMAAWEPNEEKVIRPYAADRNPNYFKKAGTAVRTVLAERTFWEKATILHQEANRDPASKLSAHCSRHYYDLYRLSRLPIRDKALGRLDLLDEVVRFKMQFYPSASAQYEQATRGHLRLMPPQDRVHDLERDYGAMEAMLFGQIPRFEEIVKELTALEETINAKVRERGQARSWGDGGGHVW